MSENNQNSSYRAAAEARKEAAAEFRDRAAELVAAMSVEECAGLLLFSSKAVERLGIKAYNWWNEALHGVARAGMATVFPQAIGMAASFDPYLLKQVAEAIAEEGRAKFNAFQAEGDYGIYKGITFWSPNVNIFRDPRWGRGQETYGEDPVLTALMGTAFVEGLQGDHPRYLKAAACAKHFAVHSGPEGKRHEFDAKASKKDMAETYLPAFKALVDADVEGFMGAYNRVNGEPACGSRYLLQDLLVGEWGFSGYITSDCWAIADFHLHHKVTETPEESAALALKNHCHLNCGNIYEYMIKALEKGLVEEIDIREAAVKVLSTRLKLGMIGEEQTPFDSIPYSVVDRAEHQRLNYEMACKSLVLLKNNGILPLAKENLKQVAVIGPNADSNIALQGNYHGTANEYLTILEALRRELPDVNISYSEGAHLYETEPKDSSFGGSRLSEVRTHCSRADLVILVVGLDETIEGEELDSSQGASGDKLDLLLPESQRLLAETVMEMNKPTLLINLSGSAIDFSAGNDAEAIVQAWYPGGTGGSAVSDLLFGKFNPSGRLPVTFYRNEHKLPAFEDYSMEGRTYKFLSGEPLYPFGYGLSYTSYSYSGLKLDSRVIIPGEEVTGSLTITNAGAMDGEEVVQFYIKDDEASFRVPKYALCGIDRVFLKAGESREITFAFPSELLKVIDDEGRSLYEPGTFTLFAGGSQPDAQSRRLLGSACVSIVFKLRS